MAELLATDCERLLDQFQPLLHKTMQKLYISLTDAAYDDYFQELQIHLIKLYDKFEGDIFKDEQTRYQFTAYAGKGLYWHGLNLRRKQMQAPMVAAGSEEVLTYLSLDDDPLLSKQSLLQIEDFFHLARLCLTSDEYALLLHIAKDEHTLEEVAQIFNVNRRTIYERRQKIKQKLNHIKDCLMD